MHEAWYPQLKELSKYDTNTDIQNKLEKISAGREELRVGSRSFVGEGHFSSSQGRRSKSLEQALVGQQRWGKGSKWWTWCEKAP